MPTFYTAIQMTNDELGNALKSLVPGPDKTRQLFGNSNGANVVLCTDQGYKVFLHEVLLRRFTNLLDGFDSTGIEELRDPFGSLVIVLQGVRDETLQALGQLLYTGECFLQSEEGKETLTEILASGVTSELSGSPEEILPSSTSSHDHQPQTEQDKTGEQDDSLQSDTMLHCSDPDISEKKVGNNCKELTDHANKDSDTTYGTVEFEEAIEVLCNDIGAESLKGAEDKIESERKNHFDDGDVEKSELKIKVEISGKENLMKNFEPSSKQKLKKSNKKSGDYHCEICNKVFTHKGDLKTHLRLHTGEKPFKCSHCDKQFAHESNLTLHKRTHTGEKPFKCSHCDKKFAQKGNVMKHERLHTGEKPFKCSYCNKWFNNKSNIKSHERTHTGEKPHPCLLCGAEFAYKCVLKYHMKNRHK